MDVASAPVEPTGMPVPPSEKTIIHEQENEKIGYDAHSAEAPSMSVEDGHPPSEEELRTLRKISAGMPWAAIGMCLIE